MTDKYRLTSCVLVLGQEKIGFYLDPDPILEGVELVIATANTRFNIQQLTSDDLRKLAILFSTFADDYDINHGVEPDMMLIQPTPK